MPPTVTSLDEELHITLSEMGAMVREEAKDRSASASRERGIAGFEHGIVLAMRQESARMDYLGSSNAPESG